MMASPDFRCRQQTVSAVPVKRETGENPVRSRRCKERVCRNPKGENHCAKAVAWEGAAYEDLRVRRPA